MCEDIWETEERRRHRQEDMGIEVRACRSWDGLEWHIVSAGEEGRLVVC